MNIGAVYEAIAPGGERVAVKVTDLRSRFETKEENDKYLHLYAAACENECNMLWKLTEHYNEKRVVKVYDVGNDANGRSYGKANYFVRNCIEKRHMRVFCFT